MPKTLIPHVRPHDKYKINTTEPEVVVWETRHPEMEAKMAMMFIERWGMVAGMKDGEDSAGRSRLRLATTDEVVSRACEMAQKACAEFERRDWFTKAPSIQEARDMMQEKENEAERSRGKGE